MQFLKCSQSFLYQTINFDFLVEGVISPNPIVEKDVKQKYNESNKLKSRLSLVFQSDLCVLKIIRNGGIHFLHWQCICWHGQWALYAMGHLSLAITKYLAGLQLSCIVCPNCCSCRVSHSAGGSGSPSAVTPGEHSPRLTKSSRPSASLMPNPAAQRSKYRASSPQRLERLHR